MRTRQGNMLQSLRDVESFLDDHAASLGDVVKSGMKQRLTDAIAALATHASDQTGNIIASRGATQKQGALRRTLLRDHMAAVARIASADLPRTPELRALRMPRGRPTTQKLAAIAKGMADAAEPHAAVFIAAGLSSDFLAKLRGAADALITSVGDRTRNRIDRSGATKGLQSKLTAGRKIVRVLDAFVQTALHDDPTLLASWNAVKRVHHVPVRPEVFTEPTPTPTSTPAPTPAATASLTSSTAA